MGHGVGRCVLAAAVAWAAWAAPAAVASDADWYTFLGDPDDGPYEKHHTIDEAAAIARDADGFLYVAGWSGRTWGTPARPFAGGSGDALVVKLDPEGHYVWHTFLGAGGPDVAQGVAVDEDGSVYVTGNSEVSTDEASDWPGDDCPPLEDWTGTGEGGFVVKLDAETGQCVWRTFVGARGNAIAFDGAGSLFVGADIGGRACVLKLSPDGARIWSPPKCAGGPTGAVTGIAPDGSGGVYVTGASPPDPSAPFVAKLGANGDLEGFRPAGDTYDATTAIAVDAGGTMYVTGRSGRKGFVRKLSFGTDAIAAEWNPRSEVGGSEQDRAWGVAVRGDGDDATVYAVGDTWGGDGWGGHENAGGVDAWVARLDANLALGWSAFLNSAAGEWGRAIVLDDQSTAYVVGYGAGAWDITEWGMAVDPYGSSDDVFVVRLRAGDACLPEDACVGDACLAKWARAWGDYVACVEGGLAEHYLGHGYEGTLGICRGTYFEKWKVECHGERFADNHDGSVTDRLTGLVWEQKLALDAHEDFSNVHDADNRYSWSTGGPPWKETGTAFDLFLRGLNAGSGFTGALGWRLPTIAELQTLMSASGTGLVPGFPDPHNAKGGYWSATSSPRVEGNCTSVSQCAWNVIFDPATDKPPTGSVPVDGKDGNRYVRAVRGGL